MLKVVDNSIHLYILIENIVIRCIQQLYVMPQMQITAWHMIVGSGLENIVSIQEKLVQDILNLKTELDTKETNFFFSSLLTGVLSHHLGWVETVMPSSVQGENSLNKPDNVLVDSYLHWYDPTRVQFRDLHGMVGSPARAAKTLILTTDEELARRIVFVLSYFIRCSQIFERKLKFDEPPGQSVKYRLNKKNLEKKFYDEEPKVEVTPPSLPKSNSSPIMEPKNKNSNFLKKSKSFIHSMNETSCAVEASSKIVNEKVNFLIGENENLDISVGVEDVNRGLDSFHLADNSQDVIITKGVTAEMKSEDDECEDYLHITEVALPSYEVSSSAPAPLPSLICCSERFMPGSVLQGCYHQQSEHWRTCLHADLLATASHQYVSSDAEEKIVNIGSLHPSSSKKMIFWKQLQFCL